jgi:hypothetical protein
VPTAAGVLDASPAKSPDQLLEQLKDSWLVKKLLPQQALESSSKPGVCLGLHSPSRIQTALGALCVHGT